MKKYYVNYYKDFGNTYTLVWAETDKQIAIAQNADYEQITRKEAEALCAKENDSRIHDTAFSGYASSVILPIDLNTLEVDWINDPRYKKVGYIVECVGKC